MVEFEDGKGITRAQAAEEFANQVKVVKSTPEKTDQHHGKEEAGVKQEEEDVKLGAADELNSIVSERLSESTRQEEAPAATQQEEID